jgi:hypothetical protein
VDAENEALALRDWRLLRPRVDEAGRALSAVLAGAPRQEPPRKWGAGGSHRPGKGYYLMPCGEARRRSRRPVFHNKSAARGAAPGGTRAAHLRPWPAPPAGLAASRVSDRGFLVSHQRPALLPHASGMDSSDRGVTKAVAVAVPWSRSRQRSASTSRVASAPVGNLSPSPASPARPWPARGPGPGCPGCGRSASPTAPCWAGVGAVPGVVPLLPRTAPARSGSGGRPRARGGWPPASGGSAVTTSTAPRPVGGRWRPGGRPTTPRPAGPAAPGAGRDREGPGRPSWTWHGGATRGAAQWASVVVVRLSGPTGPGHEHDAAIAWAA